MIPVRWYDAALYGPVETGRDVLGKPVCELRPTGRTVIVRTAPRSASRDSTEGNAFNAEERTLITPADPSAIEGATACEVGGALYDIVGVSSRESLVAIRVRRCKADGIPSC